MMPVRKRGVFFLLTRYRLRALALLAAALAASLTTGDAAGDLVARLLALDKSGSEAAQLALSASALPEAVSSRLDNYALEWTALSGLLQRALLWDSGYVFAESATSSSSASASGADDDIALVRVYTACSHSMSDLLPDVREMATLTANSSDSSQANESCGLLQCGLINNFLSADCPTANVIPFTRCAVLASDMTGIAQFSGVFWAEDGRSDAVPEPVLRRHTSENTAASESLFAIHLTADAFTGTESCQPNGEFILPCRGLADDSQLSDGSNSIDSGSRANEIDLCVPATGATMTAWLELEAVPSPSKFSTASIVLLALASALIVALCGAVWWLFRSRARLQATHERIMLDGTYDDGCWSPTSHLLGAPLAPAVAIAGTTEEERLTPMEVFFGARPRSRRTPGLGVQGTSALVATTRAEISLSNDQLCRKSAVLRAFVSDPAIVTKRISFAQLHFLRMLAKGGSGEVWLGQYEARYVAMKCLLPARREEPAALEQFAEEIRLASLLSHPRIVAFCGVAWQSLLHLCAVTEFMARGDLENVLAQPSAAKELSWRREKLMFASDIAEALVYLHSLVPIVIHRDLKSKNVLLDRRLRAKLSDFGLSRERSVEDTMTNGIGTILWSAPEVLEGKRYDEKSDLFSFGVVLSEIDTCALPYGFNRHARMRSMQIVHLVAEGKLLPSFRDDCPAPIRSLAQRCLNLDPAARPTAMEVAFELRASIIPVLRSSSSQASDLSVHDSSDSDSAPALPRPPLTSSPIKEEEEVESPTRTTSSPPPQDSTEVSPDEQKPRLSLPSVQDGNLQTRNT